MGNAPTVAVVGGGGSGTLLAIHLLKRATGLGARDPQRILMFERGPDAGRGVAYATTCDRHLLNVPAGDMSAYTDDPAHFVRWLRPRQPGAGPGSFVRRRLYGEYLRTALREARRDAGRNPTLDVVRGHVVDITARADRLVLTCGDGRTAEADSVVLAPGNFRPRRPASVSASAVASGRYIDNPWDGHALCRVAPDARVLLLGSGLTAMDAALSLDAQGHRGPIHALSRHGLVPEAHRGSPVPWPTASLTAALCTPAPWIAEWAEPRLTSACTSAGASAPSTASARGLLHDLRQRATAVELDGGDWRAVIDGLRLGSNQLWAQLPLAEQRRVLRHLRSYWNVHRHRMAPEVAGWIEALRQRGQLTVTAGRLHGCTVGSHGLHVVIGRRPPASTDTFDVDHLINCTGPETDVTALRDPLLDSLLAQGWACPGPLGMGLAVSTGGALLDRAGQETGGLWAIGSLRQGTEWETTAVPELRRQAAALAARIGAAAGSGAGIEFDSYREAV